MTVVPFEEFEEFEGSFDYFMFNMNILGHSPPLPQPPLTILYKV